MACNSLCSLGWSQSHGDPSASASLSTWITGRQSQARTSVFLSKPVTGAPESKSRGSHTHFLLADPWSLCLVLTMFLQLHSLTFSPHSGSLCPSPILARIRHRIKQPWAALPAVATIYRKSQSLTCPEASLAVLNCGGIRAAVDILPGLTLTGTLPACLGESLDE